MVTPGLLEANAKKRQFSIDRYYKNPNLCDECGEVIQVLDGVKVAEIRRRKFCSHSCAAKKNNLGKLRNPEGIGGFTENPELNLTCVWCGEPFSSKVSRKSCKHCYGVPNKSLTLTTKGELFLKCKNWQSARSTIQKHARQVLERKGVQGCSICGYHHHVEAAHKQSVSSFSPSTTLGEINDPRNLLALCPNHHWELDHGVLSVT
jgi:hypothetical protein